MFKAIYKAEACPLEGYEDVTIEVLQNASNADMNRWLEGNLGTPGCDACQALRADAGADPKARCATCAAARATFGAALVRFFRTPVGVPLAVSTPAAALATLDDEDLPTDLLTWLLLLPNAVRTRRLDELQKNLRSSSMSQD
jgi:hypothetical protein